MFTYEKVLRLRHIMANRGMEFTPEQLEDVPLDDMYKLFLNLYETMESSLRRLKVIAGYNDISTDEFVEALLNEDIDMSKIKIERSSLLSYKDMRYLIKD